MGSSGGGWVGGGHSKEFIDLVKSIGEARSQAEEDRIVIQEIETLKRRITDPEIPKRKMKEYILRLVYVEMLGHNASFGYIHAVKMAHDDSISFKRTGYLAVALFLNEDHDLIILIVNTIQKDLKSDNYLVVCAALGAVCKLINEETIPAVLPQVVQLIGHAKEAVRKKAIMALHRCYQRSPSSVDHLLSNFRKRLCDNDPGVMGATLCPLFDLISRDVNSYKDLVISFVSILKQVAEHRLPKSYDYHQMPAPFIQIKLLKILALLGSGDKQASEHMYTVIGEIFRKSDQASNIGNAILYECICCVSSIYPNTKLLEPAVDVISRFLKSDVHNLKYLGIDAISRMIKLSPEFAEIHQLAVIDCLEDSVVSDTLSSKSDLHTQMDNMKETPHIEELFSNNRAETHNLLDNQSGRCRVVYSDQEYDPDDTLKRKTFELLYKMTKPSNVEVIVENMIDYMIKISDNHYKTEIASRCVELAEQFAPTNNWFIQTMNKVFEHAGDLVNIKVAHNLMRLIAEGFEGDDSTVDTQLRSSAVESYLHIIGEPKLPSAFLQIICWVLGEYGTADGKYSTSYISGKLCDVAEAHSNDDTVKAYAVTAIMKIYAFEIANGNTVEMLPECESFIEDLTASHSTDLQQRAYELQALAGLDAHTVRIIMPLDSSCVDFEIDNTLHFLDSFVQKSLENGARMYIPESDRPGVQDGKFIATDRDHIETFTHSLRFEAYDLPNPSFTPPKPPISALSPSPEIFPPASEPSSPLEVSPESLSSLPHLKLDQPSEPRLRLDGVNRKWGRPVQPPAPLPSDTQSSEKDVESSTRTGKPRRNTAYDVEISSEKKKLAASLFGGPAKSVKPERTGFRGGNKTAAAKTDHGSEIRTHLQQPPDLLDFGSPENEVGLQPVDPFEQLEGLLGPVTEISEAISEHVSEARKEEGPSVVQKKGADTKEVIERDALVRRMGVNPVNQNPNLFKDLLS